MNAEIEQHSFRKGLLALNDFDRPVQGREDGTLLLFLLQVALVGTCHVLETKEADFPGRLVENLEDTAYESVACFYYFVNLCPVMIKPEQVTRGFVFSFRSPDKRFN